MYCTYSLGDGGFGEYARVEDHFFASSDSFNPLTRGQVCVGRVLKCGGDEGWFAGDVGGVICTIENVVGKESIDKCSI